MSPLGARLRERKLVQWALAYLGGAWLALQLLDVLIDRLGWPVATFRIGLALLGVGLLGALVLAWYHGEKGAQRVSGIEVTMLAGILVIAAAAVALVRGTGMAAAAPAVRVEAARGSPAERSIAVLPFRNLSGDTASEPFVNGIHEDILTRLSKIGDLKVISSTSVGRYKDAQEGLPAIATELGVVWILEGGVQRAGGRVHVNAQLIRAADDQHAWAETYDRELTVENIFDIQGEVARKIAESLAATISPDEEQRMAAGTTGNMTAYDLYSRGRFELMRAEEDGVLRAVELFGLATRQDSTYALAYSGVADGLVLAWSNGYDVGDRPVERAVAAARRSVALAPELAEGYASLGYALWASVDAPGGEGAYRRALELNPRYPPAHGWYSFLLLNEGRADEALDHARRAVELDPLARASHAQVANTYLATGDLPSALEHQSRSLELGPRRAPGRVTYGWWLAESGDASTGIREIERAFRDLTDEGRREIGATARLAATHGLAGRADSARVLLARAERDEEPFWIGVAYAALEDRGRALDWLAKSRYERNLPWWLRYDPVLDPLRSDPRFQKIVADMERAWGMKK